MDVTRVREDFEGLTPDQQVEFMASVGPAFCRTVMADRALRRQMMARCLQHDACPVGRVADRLRGAAVTVAALLAGARAAAGHLTQRASPAPPA